MLIYLSPHLDDAIFSCGGIIASQVEKGEDVSIWTLCAGKPSRNNLSEFADNLHAIYGYGADPIGGRISEDIKACSLLGIKYHHFSFLEAIYRKSSNGKYFLYPTPTAIFGKPRPEESILLEDMFRTLSEQVNPDCQFVVPMGLGKHVDHLLVRQAAAKLGKPLWYYQDFPYAAAAVNEKRWLLKTGLRQEIIDVEKTHRELWEKAILIYKSQVPIFWRSRNDLHRMIRKYFAEGGGKSLWQE